MRTIRHSDYTPRVEMVPLIDVIFLLLTFFIYSLVLMVRAEILPVKLTAASTGERAQPGPIAAITIDRAGQLFFNRQPITQAQLATRLEALAEQADPPRLFLAMEQAGDVDRGPLFIHLIEMIRSAGIEDFQIAGQPPDAPDPGSSSPRD